MNVLISLYRQININNRIYNICKNLAIFFLYNTKFFSLKVSTNIWSWVLGKQCMNKIWNKGNICTVFLLSQQIWFRCAALFCLFYIHFEMNPLRRKVVCKRELVFISANNVVFIIWPVIAINGCLLI